MLPRKVSRKTHLPGGLAQLRRTELNIFRTLPWSELWLWPVVRGSLHPARSHGLSSFYPAEPGNGV